MNKKTNNIYKIKLTTITPVSIGDGGVLSPLSDYIYDNDNRKIYLINHKKFEKAIENIYEGKEGKKQNKEIIDEYSKLVLGKKDKPKTDLLKDFIKNDLKENWIDLCFNNNPMEMIGRGNPLEIKTCIKNGNQPYISGSTIKGAIKTILLNDWLMTDEVKENQLYKDFLAELQKEVTHQDYQKKLSYKESKLRKFDKEKKLIEKKSIAIKDQYQNVEDLLFGKINDTQEYMDFSLLRITDSLPFNIEDIYVFRTQRFSVKKDKRAGIPINYQAVAPQKKSIFSINVDAIEIIKHPSLNFLQTDKGIKKLFSKINQASHKIIVDDYDFMNNNNYKAFNKHLDFLDKTLTNIEQLINDDENNVCYLRIGSGKNYFHNSIGVPLQETNENYFSNLINLYYPKANSSIFPSTYTLGNDNFQLPLGWVKLEYQP